MLTQHYSKKSAPPQKIKKKNPEVTGTDIQHHVLSILQCARTQPGICILETLCCKSKAYTQNKNAGVVQSYGDGLTCLRLLG